MTDTSYEERVAQQIAQYAKTVNMHELPEIFHVWSNAYLRPGMEDVFKTSTVAEFYALAYIEGKSTTDHTHSILSVGCGDGSVEMDVAQCLIGLGERDFQVICADLSPVLLGNLEKNAKVRGLSDYLKPIEVDLNKTPLPGRFDMIMAHHSLHHIVELEILFAYCHEHLKDHGIFATMDMIGRNGHMRWPETAAILSALWPTLKPESRYHAQLQRLDDRFNDHDCSKEGFEGVRAQDILQLLLKHFKPYKFHGSGGFVDLLIDRGYGHSYDVNSPSDVSIIKFLAELNEMMLDANVVKPTVMLAYFCKDDRPELFYRNRRASTAVRLSDPEWVKFYGSV
jgi:cyclopropane fatty-acyl-phospholipid synthase-like methyltransferase